MARPKSTDTPDLTAPINLTVGAIQRLVCPSGKAQVFMRDSVMAGLKVRVTSGGSKSFIYERMVNYKNMRKTIGSVDVWTIEAARAEARRLAVEMDKGHDPREQERERRAAGDAKRTAEALDAITVGEVWKRYLEDRRPHWGERHLADHLKLSKAGGLPRGRRPGVLTIDGPIVPLLALPLADLDAPRLEAWATAEAKTRPARVRLALRLVKAFLRWCDEQPDLQGRADTSATSSRRLRETAGRAKAGGSVLLKEQLSTWFKHVQAIQNPVIAAYLQTCLLTGARPGEVATLRWEDVNLRWNGMAIRDKVEGERTIPLTPYVRNLITRLPRVGEWVFPSLRTLDMSEANVVRRGRRHEVEGKTAPMAGLVQVSAAGHLVNPSTAHRRACAAAGLDDLTLHGLRRSFKSLSEWLECPVGVVAQIMGHKPSATAEKHYTQRPLDLLRVHHERIEGWILAEAGISPDDKAEAATPRLHRAT